MPDTTIRPVAAGDMAAITAIYQAAVAAGTASFELDPPDVAEMTRRRDSLLAADYPYLVADRRGDILGYAYAGPYRTRPAYRFTVENSIYIDETAHRRGIGRRLLEALIEQCLGRGYRQMVAVIGDSGNRASIRLHEAAGFRAAGILKSVGWKHGRWIDSVLMQRDLGAGDREPPAQD